MQIIEKWEVALGIVDLVLTFGGLIFVIFGWIIPYKQRLALEQQRKESEVKFLKLKWEKELIDNQISLFYGPISALLNEQIIVRDKIFQMIGRNYIFDEKHQTFNSLSEKDQKIWAHYVDSYKIPLNNKINEIIRNNKHLIYESRMPCSVKKYIDYMVGWELLDNQKRNNVPNNYEYKYYTNFPAEFSIYIESTLKILLYRQAELTGILKINTE